jgi:hypothetical protein
VHVIAYAILLAVITAVIPLDASFGGDDGAYGGQVHALDSGGWALERPLPVVEATNEGWLNTAITPSGPLPYTSNPAYALLLQAMGWAGVLGLKLVPLLGALASAAVAWALTRLVGGSGAPRADHGPAALAFWLVALGPVLVNSTTLWAHTISTALAGGSLWCLLALADGTGGRRRTAFLVTGLAITLGLAALLRTEAIFWIGAVAATALVVTAGWAARLGSAVAVAVGLGAWVANRSWGAALRADRLPIDTAVVSPESTSTWLAGRIPAAWRLLLTSLGGGIGPLIALVAVSLAIVAAVKIRRAGDLDGSTMPAARSTTALLLGSAAVYLLHAVFAPGETISGTVAAWPIVVVLLVAGRPLPSDISGRWNRGGKRPAGVGPVLLPAGLVALAVLATQYSISGGHQWGGRYLSMAFVPLAVAAAVNGWPVLTSAYRPGVVTLLLAPAVVGVAASFQLHANHRDIVADSTSIPADVVITPAVALPRIAWTELPTAFYVADETTVDRLLGDLAAAGVESVNVHGLRDHDVDGTAQYRQTASTDTIRHLELDPAP